MTKAVIADGDQLRTGPKWISARRGLLKVYSDRLECSNSMTRHDGIFTFLDWITEPPRGGRPQMWVVGAGLAVLTLVYGASCVITQSAIVPRLRVRGMGGMHQGMFTEIGGNAAVAYGILAVFVSLFIHFQWFWGNHPRLSRYYEIGKYGTLLGLLATVLAFAYTSMAPLW